MINWINLNDLTASRRTNADTTSCTQATGHVSEHVEERSHDSTTAIRINGEDEDEEEPEALVREAVST